MDQSEKIQYAALF